eukprot:1140215-Pelagomonas_calceolata.AAC.4
MATCYLFPLPRLSKVALPGRQTRNQENTTLNHPRPAAAASHVHSCLRAYTIPLHLQASAGPQPNSMLWRVQESLTQTKRDGTHTHA